MLNWLDWEAITNPYVMICMGLLITIFIVDLAADLKERKATKHHK